MRLSTAVLVLVLLLAPAAAAEEKRAADANPFSIDLFHALRDRPGNLFCSPFSVYAALAMAREGAAGETAAQLDAVLHRGGGSLLALSERLRPETVKDGYGRDAKEVEAYRLSIANAVWAQEGLSIEEPFSARLADDYGAPLRRLDFRKTAAARAAINGWVAKETRGRIEKIVPEDLPTPDTLMALANAIWFRAAWDRPFEERWTKEGPFFAGGEEPATASYMLRTGSYRYAAADGVRIVEIPYRKGKTSMVLLLPEERDGLGALEASLTSEKLDGWIAAAKPASLRLALPKFEIENALDLTRTLPAMGMTDAFDGAKADFSGMTKEARLFIGAVLHKSFVTVDEAGTEAAAATVVMMLKGRPPEPIEFRADHPFLFLIRHAGTGQILFLGRLADPTKG